MIEYENLRLVNAEFEEAFQKQFKDLLNSGWYILGSQVSSFESEFAAFHGGGEFIGVASGLDALLLSLKALDLPADAEVIVPSNTYIATILAILNAGLKPVLVEPRIDTYNIDPELLEAATTPRTAALMIVHLYGSPCNMKPIMAYCNRHNLHLIEDCAQAHGATYQGRQVGTFGIGAFSFYPTKNLGALGDAGGILLSESVSKGGSAPLAHKLRALRNYGSQKKYYNDLIGFNSRLDEIQAAFLRVKLPALKKITEHKQNLAVMYDKGLKQEFIKPTQEPESTHVYHIYNVRHPRRDDLRNFLLEKGIKTEIHYPVPPNKQVGYAEILKGNYPISEEIHQTTLSLPISVAHTESQIEVVIRAMNSF